MFKIVAFLFFTTIALPTVSYSAQVSENQGNIYYNDQQLTHSGNDSHPVLSPDGKQLAFVHQLDDQNTELWLIDVSGQNAHVLIQPRTADTLEKSLAGFNNPLFSLNGKALYFLTTAWATSDAVHVIDLSTHKQQFITDGNSVDIVPTGKYKGYLIVSKHKYHKGGGSYEDFWLVSPKGKEIKSLGEEQAGVNAFIRAN